MSRRWPSRPEIAVWGSAALFYAVFIARVRFVHDGASGFTLFDDAMISMRYARNLVEGHGLVFNPGQPPVEGYTNPLWTLWMAALHGAGFGDMTAPLAVMVSGVFLLACTAVLAATLVRETWGSAPAALIAAALVLFDYALTFWTLRGMEVGLLGLLATASVLAVLRFERTMQPRDLAVAAIASAAAVLTRRDAVIVPLVVGGYLAWSLAGAQRTRALCAIGFTTVAALAVQTGFSLWYYGDPLPNTYYLKLTGVPIGDRLARGVPMLALVFVRNLAPLLVPACIPLLTGTRSQRKAAALLAALVAVPMGYSALVGGDAWEYNGHANRYIATAIPAACVLAAVGVVQAAERGWLLRVASVILVAGGVRVAAEIGSLAYNWAPMRGHRLYLAAPGLVSVIAAGVAALLCGVGAALWRRPPAVATVRGTCAAAVLVWAFANGTAFAAWAAGNADHVRLDERWARKGLRLRSLVSADTVVAVTAAGNLPYFSRLRAIDLLGKMDPVIARMPPAGLFRPGHDKWNVQHSICSGRPDVVSEFAPTAAEDAYLRDRGYDGWPGHTFVLRTSTAFDHAALRAVFTAAEQEDSGNGVR